MAFPDYDYNIYEDFENALASPWSEDDPNNIVTPNSAIAKYYGTYGMLVDMTQGAYFGGVFVSVAGDNISMGIWWKTPAIGEQSTLPMVFGTEVDIQWRDDGGGLYLRAVSADSSNDSSSILAEDTWYWITAQYLRNSTFTLRIYNEAKEEIDTIACTCQNAAIGNIGMGCMSSRQGTSAAYFGCCVIDNTDATFPLLGWETGGGGGSIVPLMMNLYRRRKI